MLNEDDQTFVKYWFELVDDQLKYSEAKDGDVQGTVNLEDCSPEIVTESKYERKCCFELNTPYHSKVFVLAVENSSTLQEWTLALRRSMLRLRRKKAKSARLEAKQREQAPPANILNAPLDANQAEAAMSEVDEDKYDVYTQWLDEVKMDNSDASTLNRGLLGHNRRAKTGGCACCSHCTIA